MCMVGRWVLPVRLVTMASVTYPVRLVRKGLRVLRANLRMSLGRREFQESKDLLVRLDLRDLPVRKVSAMCRVRRDLLDPWDHKDLLASATYPDLLVLRVLPDRQVPRAMQASPDLLDLLVQ